MPETAVLVASVVVIGIYVVVAVLRLTYPYELQWMEGGSVDQLRRLLDGRSLYPPPSIDFVSFTYPPLYYVVSAPFAWLTGVGFFPLRLVSFVASLGTMAVLATSVRAETGRWSAGLASAGIFAAAFGVTGSWYDVARVDSLFVFFLVAGIAVAAPAGTVRRGAAAGALFALAALTKQTAVFVAVPVCVALVARRRQVGVAAATAFAVPTVVASVALDVASGGWYRFFTVDVLLGHHIEHSRWLHFPLVDIGLHLVPALVLVGLAFRRPGVPSRWRTYVVGAVACVAAAWISRLHSGGYVDVLIPAFTGVAWLTGLAFAELRTAGRGRLATGVLIAQLVLLLPVPFGQVPTAADRVAGRQLVEGLRPVKGDVLVVSHPTFAVLAGKPSHAQAAAIGDLYRGRPSHARAVLGASIEGALREQRFALVAFDGEDDASPFAATLALFYRRVPPPASLGARLPRPLTDLRTSPTMWWAPIGRRG